MVEIKCIHVDQACLEAIRNGEYGKSSHSHYQVTHQGDRSVHIVRQKFVPVDHYRAQKGHISVWEPGLLYLQLSDSGCPGLLELQRHDARYPGLLSQPDSRPISQEQITEEVNFIYAGLTMVETKCIHVDRVQAMPILDSSFTTTSTSHAHWHDLTALYRTPLHEHHDFFLASQYPTGPDTAQYAAKYTRSRRQNPTGQQRWRLLENRYSTHRLQRRFDHAARERIAAKYSMPARMWKHGMHSFLEVCFIKLPVSKYYMLAFIYLAYQTIGSNYHMLAFIYLAYQMMALLHDTVPAIKHTWIECLGDLSRYRMAIREGLNMYRETWASVNRPRCTTADKNNPAVRRLYHHLAILAQPDVLRQPYHYCTRLVLRRVPDVARDAVKTSMTHRCGGATTTDLNQQKQGNKFPTASSTHFLRGQDYVELPAIPSIHRVEPSIGNGERYAASFVSFHNHWAENISVFFVERLIW
jgi:hypothetical protein